MVFPFTMSRDLEEKSLEGMSIIVCVRWMLFAPLTLGFVALFAVALSAESARDTFYEHYFLPLVVAIYLSLIVRDVWLVRRVAISWEESRIRSLNIMKRLPTLLLILVPVFIFVKSPRSTGPIIEWISGMLWVFSILSVLFYLVYFTLLISLLRLPQPAAILGFLLALSSSISGANEQIKKANKTSLLTLEPPQVQAVMKTTTSTLCSILAPGQA
jgi:hypothetical protein